MFGSAINNKGKREKNQRVKEGPCIFPFNYKLQEHNTCIATDKGDICATSIKEGKRHTLKTYGYCVKKSAEEKLKKAKTLKILRKLKGRRITIKKIEKKISKSEKNKTLKAKMPKKVASIS